MPTPTPPRPVRRRPPLSWAPSSAAEAATRRLVRQAPPCPAPRRSTGTPPPPLHFRNFAVPSPQNLAAHPTRPTRRRRSPHTHLGRSLPLMPATLPHTTPIAVSNREPISHIRASPPLPRAPFLRHVRPLPRKPSLAGAFPLFRSRRPPTTTMYVLHAPLNELMPRPELTKPPIADDSHHPVVGPPPATDAPPRGEPTANHHPLPLLSPIGIALAYTPHLITADNPLHSDSREKTSAPLPNFGAYIGHIHTTVIRPSSPPLMLDRFPSSSGAQQLPTRPAAVLRPAGKLN